MCILWVKLAQNVFQFCFICNCSRVTFSQTQGGCSRWISKGAQHGVLVILRRNCRAILPHEIEIRALVACKTSRVHLCLGLDPEPYS